MLFLVSRCGCTDKVYHFFFFLEIWTFVLSVGRTRLFGLQWPVGTHNVWAFNEQMVDLHLAKWCIVEDDCVPFIKYIFSISPWQCGHGKHIVLICVYIYFLSHMDLQYSDFDSSIFGYTYYLLAALHGRNKTKRSSLISVGLRSFALLSVPPNTDSISEVRTGLCVLFHCIKIHLEEP